MSFFLGSWGMNRSAEQTNHPRTASRRGKISAAYDTSGSDIGHCVIYGVESWNGVVEWSGVWSGVELEFGVKSPLKQNNTQFCMGRVF